MERAAGTGPPSVAQSWRTTLRADLVAAMMSRDQDAVVALRTTIAAIDNAQAIEQTDGPRPAASDHVAGAGAGVGSTEATRRELGTVELHDVVAGEVADRRREADRYDALGRPDRAEHLRRQAEVLAQWLERQRP